MPSQLEVRTRSVGPWPMNTYVLVCPHTQQSVLIDPGAEPETLQEMLAGTTPIAILLTHTHPDHVGELETMREKLNVPLMAFAGRHFNGMELNADRELRHGDAVEVGRHQLHVHYTPGHIDDMICFVEQGHPTQAIVGDTIFEGGPGRTWTAEGFQTTIKNLRDIILSWPDDTICYPGHGPHFRLGDKRAAIEAFVAKDHGPFFGDAAWEM